MTDPDAPLGSAPVTRPILEVDDLHLQFSVGRARVRAVDGVSFSLRRGETLGLVGESGSGKTSLGYALLGLLPSNGRVVRGRVALDGTAVTGASPQVLRTLRWRRIAMVFQNAMAALNPVFTIGQQLVDAMREHGEMTVPEARRRAASLLERVAVPSSRLDAYPHELSGGQRQRVMIALAISCDPDVLVADEPTTALDLVAQAQVLDLLRELQADLGLTIILISHDLGAVASLCSTIAVLYAGQVVEYGPRARVLQDPQHPYTMALLRAYPRLDGPVEALWTIGGNPPSLIAPPTGCRFHPRCSFATETCRTEIPPARDVAQAGYARCHYAGQLPVPVAAHVPEPGERAT